MSGSGFTTYFAQKIMGHVFNGQAWTPPATYYAVPHTGWPTDLGTAYPSALTTRLAVTLSVPDANGLVTTSADLTWVQTTPEAISHFSVWDAATGGHCCFIKAVEKIINYYVGDTIVLPKFSIQLPPAVDLSELNASA